MTKEQTEGSGRPKRIRRQVEQNEPPTSSTGIASSVKRRRLNGLNPTPASASPAPAPAPVPPPISNKNDTNGRRTTRNKSAPKENQNTKSIYDRIPGSSEDEKQKKPSGAEPTTAIKYRKLGLKRPRNQPTSRPKGIYEVPESDDEPHVSKQVNDSEENRGLSPVKERVGNGLSNILSQKEESDSRPKRRGRPPKIKNQIEVSSSQKETIAVRLAKSVVDSPQKEAPKLKGILTPQKNKLGRPRKSVAFDKDTDAPGSEVYFEDLPSKPKSSAKPKKQTKIQIEEEQASENEEEEGEDSEDDEVCAICLKPDSEPPNEIIFCENCDMAAHQECYDVPVIPEGDWICRNCSQEDVLPGSKPTPKALEPQGAISVGIPKIPNFEQHLRNMQRVLLDRCSGIRRIKLQGQDEAYEKAFQLVEQTVLAGEGNSMMVIGSRGCGKTTVRPPPQFGKSILNSNLPDGRDDHIGPCHRA